jgi:hypothetical protein
MTASILQQLLLCVAAASCWQRFSLIFSPATGHSLLLGPMTSVATAVFLCSASLVFTEFGVAVASFLAVIIALTAFALTKANSALMAMVGATCLSLYFVGI